MDIEKLIEQLEAWNEQHLSVVCGNGHFACDYLCENEDCIVVRAAAAIAKLQTENKKLRADLERVKQERDEAVQCIRGIAKSGRVWMCPYCVHAKDTTGGIAECELDVGVCMMPYSKFEWRGPQKED